MKFEKKIIIYFLFSLSNVCSFNHPLLKYFHNVFFKISNVISALKKILKVNITVSCRKFYRHISNYNQHDIYAKYQNIKYCFLVFCITNFNHFIILKNT